MGVAHKSGMQAWHVVSVQISEIKLKNYSWFGGVV